MTHQKASPIQLNPTFLKPVMIDLRSDTVTKPCEAMRKTMAQAEVGDDVYGEDPTVIRLEHLASEMLGTEASIFASSGTQTNLLGILAHCERGEEYIVGQTAHTYKYEAGGAAVLGSIQPQPIEFENDGTLCFEKIKAKIKPDDYHFAISRLLCLENTQGGKVLPMQYLSEARDFASCHNLNMHLDGARLFNASVALGVAPSEIARYFDTISICLSKGLGAPVGSLLCGPKDLIAKARRWRKMLGGGMRQAGILAAAGIYALENNIKRLADDHANAALLANELSKIEGINVLNNSAETNMVFLQLDKTVKTDMASHFKSQNIIIPSDNPARLVTHLDVTTSDINRIVHTAKDPG